MAKVIDFHRLEAKPLSGRHLASDPHAEVARLKRRLAEAEAAARDARRLLGALATGAPGGFAVVERARIEGWRDFALRIERDPLTGDIIISGSPTT